ncbi:MAG: hypothetical protein V7696_19735 [Halioglobus sp.]
MMNALKTIIFVVVIIALQSCRIIQTAPPSGSIISSSGNNDCMAGNTCVVDVQNGSTFNDTFTAVPEPGYTFRGWKKAKGHLCGGKKAPCELRLPGNFTEIDFDASLVAVFGSPGSYSDFTLFVGPGPEQTEFSRWSTGTLQGELNVASSLGNRSLLMGLTNPTGRIDGNSAMPAMPQKSLIFSDSVSGNKTFIQFGDESRPGISVVKISSLALNHTIYIDESQIRLASGFLHSQWGGTSLGYEYPQKVAFRLESSTSGSYATGTDSYRSRFCDSVHTEGSSSNSYIEELGQSLVDSCEGIRTMLTDLTGWYAPSGWVKAVLDEAVEMLSGDLPEYLDELEQEVSAIPAEELPLSPFVGSMDSFSCHDFGVYDEYLGMQECLVQANDQYPTVVEEIQNESTENAIFNTDLAPESVYCQLQYEDNAGYIGSEGSCVSTRDECQEAGGTLRVAGFNKEGCLRLCPGGGLGLTEIAYTSYNDNYHKSTCVDINDMGKNIMERVSQEDACSAGFVEACNSDPGDGAVAVYVYVMIIQNPSKCCEPSTITYSSIFETFEEFSDVNQSKWSIAFASSLGLKIEINPQSISGRTLPTLNGGDWVSGVASMWHDRSTAEIRFQNGIEVEKLGDTIIEIVDWSP